MGVGKSLSACLTLSSLLVGLRFSHILELILFLVCHCFSLCVSFLCVCLGSFLILQFAYKTKVCEHASCEICLSVIVMSLCLSVIVSHHLLVLLSSIMMKLLELLFILKVLFGKFYWFGFLSFNNCWRNSL